MRWIRNSVSGGVDPSPKSVSVDTSAAVTRRRWPNCAPRSAAPPEGPLRCVHFGLYEKPRRPVRLPREPRVEKELRGDVEIGDVLRVVSCPPVEKGPVLQRTVPTDVRERLREAGVVVAPAPEAWRAPPCLEERAGVGVDRQPAVLLPGHFGGLILQELLRRGLELIGVGPTAVLRQVAEGGSSRCSGRVSTRGAGTAARRGSGARESP